VGLHAIRVGCPTKVLGIAVFDIAGLTHQAPLDTFWTAPEPVDAGLAADFVRALAGTIQVKGSFYHPAGQRAGQAEIVRRVAGRTVNEPGAFVDPPPRLARAIRTGVPVVGEAPAPQLPAGDVPVTGP
jgi:capsular polysaccharide export protein